MTQGTTVDCDEPTLYAITVSFAVRMESRADFLELVRANAATSLAREPDCLRFDVLAPLAPGEADVVLYEVYADRAAFEAHLRSDHFLAFDSATRDMLTTKTIAEYATWPTGPVVEAI